MPISALALWRTSFCPAVEHDVFIHCGDLTQYGGLPSFRRAIEDIKTVNAELKLVIAGNHDVNLDPAWLENFAEDDDDVAIGAQCLSLLQSQQEHGIYYLNEGTHGFTLWDGRSFTVYATPYTPEFGEFAFLYGPEEDRFNDGPHKVPEGVDLVVSHGPPAFPGLSGYRLDVSERGEHCGCEKLAKALERVKPRLCCFGHIHEGCGAAKMDCVSWRLENASFGDVNTLDAAGGGKETLLVNAAISGDMKGWYVDIGL
jgi:hypothetical protein